jgi:hypothetical protein
MHSDILTIENLRSGNDLERVSGESAEADRAGILKGGLVYFEGCSNSTEPATLSHFPSLSNLDAYRMV